MQAINLIKSETCLKFNMINSHSVKKQGIFFKLSNSYESELGKQANKKIQVIYIQKIIYNIGNILRELFHTLGVEYEYRRPDRNKYIFILKKSYNSTQSNQLNINYKYATEIQYPPYDYGSLMHDNFNHDAKNSLNKILIPLNYLYSTTIGQNISPTFLDIKKLNFLYCSDICKKKRIKIICLNGGYQDPKICRKCKCVYGFSGRHCEKMQRQRSICGKTTFLAEWYTSTIELKGKMSCIFYLATYVGHKIGITIDYVNIEQKYVHVCQPTNSLEVKYEIDKSNTGPRFCFVNKKITFFSKDNLVLVYFNNEKGVGGFKLSFKRITTKINTLSLKRYNFVDKKK